MNRPVINVGGVSLQEGQRSFGKGLGVRFDDRVKIINDHEGNINCGRRVIKTCLVQSDDEGCKLLLEFDRGDRINTFTPSAVRKYLRTVNAMTAGVNFNAAREKFLAHMRTLYPQVFDEHLQYSELSPVKLFIPTYDEHLYKAPYIYPVGTQRLSGTSQADYR